MATAEEARRELARRELARRRGQTQEAQSATTPSAQAPGIASDVVASFSSGAAGGAADLVGLPGTIGDALYGGWNWALRNGYELATGETPSSDGGAVERFFAGPQEGIALQNPLSGDSIRGAMSTISGGATDYQPYSTAGEYARTVGEFLPGAASFGGASLANIGRYGVLPALASETAGQATEDTVLEPFARIAGAFAGGAVGSRLGRSTPRQPSAAEIRQSAGYGQLDDAMRQAKLTGDAYRNIVRDIWDDAQDFGLTTDLRRQFGGVLNDFSKRAQASGGASLHDLELLRRSLRNAAGNTLDRSAQSLSGRLIDKLDDAVDALSAQALSGAAVNERPVVDALREARQVYRTGVKSQMIEDAVQRAQSAASGVENGLRVEFRKLVNNPRLAKNFTTAEREAIRNVAEGNFTTNALRWIGSFGVPIDQGRNFLGSLSGGGVGATIGGLIGGAPGATIGGFALPAVGTAAKMGASRATRNMADIAEALVKAGPQGQQAFTSAQAAGRTAYREAILRNLLQSQSSARIPYARELLQE